MSYKKIHAFGLDISDFSIEMVLLDRKKKLKCYARETLPFGIVVNWKIKDKQALAEVLLKMREKLGSELKTDNVVIALPENKVFAHVFNVPKALATDVKVILKLAQEHIPLDLNESIFDYQIVQGQDVSRKERRIYFAAVEERLIFDYLEVLTAAKLKVVAIDIEPVSTARALFDSKNFLTKLTPEKKKQKSKKKLGKKKGKIEKEKGEVKQQEKPIVEILKDTLPRAEMVLDVGAKHSVVTIFYNLHIFPSISLPIGGHTFTQILQEKCEITDFEEAQKEKMKLITGSDEFEKVQSAYEAEWDKIIREVQAFADYFEKNNDVVIKALHVTGGSSKLCGLFEYVKEKLSIEVKQAEAVVKSKKGFDQDLYLNGIGLALRGVSKDPVTEDLNLLPAHQRRLLVEQSAKNAIIYSSLVVLAVSSTLIAAFNIVLSNLYFDLEGLEKANQSFHKITEGQRYQEIQAHLQELNDSAQLVKQKQETTYSVKEIYTYFQANVPQAVVINQFNYQNKESYHLIEINGFALNREHVLALQAEIKSKPFYTNVVEPVSNFLKQSDIYFFFSFDFELEEFQKYLEEEEKKKEEEKQASLQNQLEAEEDLWLQNWGNSVSTGGAYGTGHSSWKTGWSGAAYSAWTGEVVLNWTDAFQNETGSTIIDLGENIMSEEDLAELSAENVKMTGEMEEAEEEDEDVLIEEILKNSNNEYPFQDKIHEKVGDIFVIEQTFYSGSGGEATEAAEL